MILNNTLPEILYFGITNHNIMNPTSPTIRKPLDDHRTYQYIQLPNGIRAVLVSDDKISNTFFNFRVNVGSLSDPDEFLGLAHFLEHMLFLGTAKYPNVKEFEEFLGRNNGGNNAYTSADHTTYQFQISSTATDRCLDIFSRFFIDPLFERTVCRPRSQCSQFRK